MKNKRIILPVLAGILIFSSCKKQLDQQPTGQFAEANAFTSFEHVQNGVNGAHGLLSAYARDMYANALVSDEAKLGAGNAGQGALTYRYQFSSDATSGGSVTAAYSDYYFLIDHINRVLPYIYTVSATPEEDARRDKVKGQLLALRGIAHFELLQAYCKKYNASEPLGVPIMLESNATAKPARNTMGDVMTQIEKDLADAKNLLPAVTPATFTDTSINKVNLAAYQARIALYKGDYANAITYSSEVISSGVKPLSSGANFQGIWTDQTNNEVLLRRRYSNSSSIGTMWTTTGGDIYIAPSDKLIAAYSVDDIRKATYIGTDGSGNNYVNKFYVSSRGGRVVDSKIARISEMYLIRAEANAKKTSPDIAAGAADLNLLRSMRITGYVDESFATASDLFDAVIEERYKELCFEGFRLFDLKRNSLPVQRDASDASPAWQTLAADNFRFVFPIPAYELLANPNMVQNEGY